MYTNSTKAIFLSVDILVALYFLPFQLLIKRLIGPITNVREAIFLKILRMETHAYRLQFCAS
jgi:hypothetical protein